MSVLVGLSRRGRNTYRSGRIAASARSTSTGSHSASTGTIRARLPDDLHEHTVGRPVQMPGTHVADLRRGQPGTKAEREEHVALHNPVLGDLAGRPRPQRDLLPACTAGRGSRPTSGSRPVRVPGAAAIPTFAAAGNAGSLPSDGSTPGSHGQ